MSASKEESGLEETPKEKNVNDRWKNLDAIFQAQLRTCVLSNDTQKFNAVTQELGFNDIQKGLLFDAIQTFNTHYMTTPNAQPPLNICNNNTNNATNANNANNANNTNNNNNKAPKKRKKSKKSTTKNEKVSGKKRRRSDISNYDSSSDDNDNDNDDEADDNIFTVDKIIGHKLIGDNKYKYHVKWVGYDDLSWEPHKNLMKSTINKYWSSIGFKCDKHGNIKELSEKTKRKKRKKEKKEKKGEQEQEEYKCVECNRTFKNGWALGGHKASKHPKKKKLSNKKESELMLSSDDDIDIDVDDDHKEENDDNDRDMLIVESD